MERMNIRRLVRFDVVNILRKEGVIIGYDVVMDSAKFISKCHLLGFRPNDVYEVLHIF